MAVSYRTRTQMDQREDQSFATRASNNELVGTGII